MVLLPTENPKILLLLLSPQKKKCTNIFPPKNLFIDEITHLTAFNNDFPAFNNENEIIIMKRKKKTQHVIINVALILPIAAYSTAISCYLLSICLPILCALHVFKCICSFCVYFSINKTTLWENEILLKIKHIRWIDPVIIQLHFLSTISASLSLSHTRARIRKCSNIVQKC